MSVKLLDQIWNSKQVSAASRTGPVIEYSNDQIGVFALTHGASREIGEVPSNVVLSSIYQVSLSGKELVICLNDEKEVFTSSSLRTATMDEILAMYPVSFVEKQAAILRSFYSINPNVGEQILLKALQPYMFYSRNEAEMKYLLELMQKKDLIKQQVVWTVADQAHPIAPFVIQEKGWLLLEEIVMQERSRSVFVAMWFDKSMHEAYQAIQEAIGALGFEALRIDEKQHNNEISGEILYEIRRCRFVIADVTNQRHGVYFEAGYAMGKGIPVIWSCKSSDLANVHFDTRQYNHVVWEDTKDLKQKIAARVKGTILR